MAPSPRRSGCSLALGILLVGSGTLLLLSNLFGFSLEWVWRQALPWLAVYWPVILIVWGLYKIYQRVMYPESARVGGGEILLLLFIVFLGVTFSLTTRLADRLRARIDLGDLADIVGAEIALGPPRLFASEERLSLPEGRGLAVSIRRGSASIEGWDETDVEAVLTKRVYERSPERAERLAADTELELEVPAQGAARLSLRLGTDTADTSGAAVETELKLRVPRSTALTVTSADGFLHVRGMRAPVELTGEQEAIEVSDVHGDVHLTSRRGDLRAERIQGRVETHTRHGSVTLREIEGEVVAETSGASLRVEAVSGGARLVNRDGMLVADRITGDVDIDAPYCEVSVESAGANVTIRSSYRPVFVRSVAGQLGLESRNAEIELREIMGSVDVQTMYRSVVAVEIGGRLSIRAPNAAVSVHDVLGSVEIDSSHHRVEVQDFRERLRVSSTHAEVTAETAALGGDVQLGTTYGDIRLSLPASSSFRLQALSRDGSIASDFQTPEWESRAGPEGRELSGRHGEGVGVSVTLESSYGDIQVSEWRTP